MSRIYYFLTQNVDEEEMEEESLLMAQEASQSLVPSHQRDVIDNNSDLSFIDTMVERVRRGKKVRNYFHLSPYTHCPYCSYQRMYLSVGGYRNNRNAVICLKCNNMIGQ